MITKQRLKVVSKKYARSNGFSTYGLFHNRCFALSCSDFLLYFLSDKIVRVSGLASLFEAKFAMNSAKIELKIKIFLKAPYNFLLYLEASKYLPAR